MQLAKLNSGWKFFVLFYVVFWAYALTWCRRKMQKDDLSTGTGSRGGQLGRSPPWNLQKYLSSQWISKIRKKNIRDTRTFCRPLFYHSSAVKYTSSLIQHRSCWSWDLTTKYHWNRSPCRTGWTRPCYQHEGAICCSQNTLGLFC